MRFLTCPFSGDMMLYSGWASVLTTLSVCTQAVLPTLYHSVCATHAHIAKLSDLLEDIIVYLRPGATYKGLQLKGTQEDLEKLVEWGGHLIAHTTDNLSVRFDLSSGKLLWAASLFDRRTWPHGDMVFDTARIVEPKLAALRREFPFAKQLNIVAGAFVQTTRAASVVCPLQRSASSRVRAADAVYVWQRASDLIKGEALQKVVQLATALCTVPLSQSSTEQLNSIIKLVHGTRRHLLNAKQAAGEILLRSTTMDEQELV